MCLEQVRALSFPSPFVLLQLMGATFQRAADYIVQLLYNSWGVKSMEALEKRVPSLVPIRGVGLREMYYPGQIPPVLACLCQASWLPPFTKWHIQYRHFTPQMCSMLAVPVSPCHRHP